MWFAPTRMKSYYFGCGNQPRNSLWTYSYKPKTAMEVCVNDESVKFLSGWLQQWRERKFQICKDHIDCDTSDREKDDYIYSESDSDSGSQYEEDRLKNVLLVTGPVGVTTKTALSCYNYDESWYLVLFLDYFVPDDENFYFCIDMCIDFILSLHLFCSHHLWYSQ
ncbi:uncharacterized protein LOC133820962 [Humulus lupulus]|uniref:uncharacterized protein LOC133820962 n=1 Tax=Humulus lupulus TaxID=3486 RepID=UPI002B4139BC|nr:uncharacterized protein LOC133820962 [Humulus lupulus]